MLTTGVPDAGEPASRPFIADTRTGADADLDPAASLERPGQYRFLAAGDTALVVEFGERMDRLLSAQVLGLARRLDEIRLTGVIETVPTFRSLMVHYDR